MMDHFYRDLEGEKWFDYEVVYSMAVWNAKNDSHFVEVGSWKGMSACYMAVEIINSNKKIKFDCIDNWSQGDTREEFIKNIEPVRDLISLIDMVSWDAAKLYKDRSIDFCFLDAAHDYNSKTKDITSWLPKIKIGGIIAGHDYTPNMDEYNRTYEAVNNILGKENIKTINNVWFYEVT